MMCWAAAMRPPQACMQLPVSCVPHRLARVDFHPFNRPGLLILLFYPSDEIPPAFKITVLQTHQSPLPVQRTATTGTCTRTCRVHIRLVASDRRKPHCSHYGLGQRRALPVPHVKSTARCCQWTSMASEVYASTKDYMLELSSGLLCTKDAEESWMEGGNARSRDRNLT